MGECAPTCRSGEVRVYLVELRREHRYLFYERLLPCLEPGDPRTLLRQLRLLCFLSRSSTQDHLAQPFYLFELLRMLLFEAGDLRFEFGDAYVPDAQLFLELVEFDPRIPLMVFL